ncbi:inorganic phosphate transporter [Streptomyces sp. SID11385]|uniref:inorganic phosphate transporter n=1 Tax=Streptomyces sp. SID11385 TaxID=2706031 RepID=UPI0013C76283|nr:inorganic phosphate transporter [Streptomyces sp. SID11385]NEA37834.1 inorganic phosphate transporter [Streptomyces sp. SID11385]
MEHITLLLGIVIVTALVFDFTNGFHDTANAMATTISTGALKPKTAVAMSAALNLVGAFLSVEVAKTISGGIVDESGLRTEVIFAALVGAILWNLVTWLLGLPSSSSHALFGGLIGAAVMSAGFSSINGGTIVTKIVIPAVAAPVVAGLASFAATRLTYRLTRGVDEKTGAKGYKVGQIASAGLVSLAHGTNDAQKTMGIITLALVTGDVLKPGSNPPVWVILSAGCAIALGTYLGGWRIVRTMGTGLTELAPPQGFASQTGAATVILASSHLGFSLSTTQACSGSVMGAGLGRKGGTVRWSTAGRMAIAWLLTLPAAALVGAGAEFLTRQGTWGVALTGVLLLAGAGTIYVLSRRQPVSHHDVAGEAEPAGVVTQALASVAPPPAGTLTVPLQPTAAEAPDALTAAHPPLTAELPAPQATEAPRHTAGSGTAA